MEIVPVYGIREFVEEHNQNSFYSNTLKVHLKSHQFVNSPHKHSTYIAILFTKGTGKHLIDFDSFQVKSGAVFLLNPGQVHNWQLSADADGFVFFHSKEFYDSIFSAKKIEDFPFFYLQQNYPVVYLKKKEIEAIEILFIEIDKEFYTTLPYRLEKLGSLVNLVYIELSRLYKLGEEQVKDSNHTYLKVKKLQKLIDENFKLKKLPSEYADMMNMTTRHLSRICRLTLNKSTSDLIADRIIMEARRILVHNDITIAMLADQLGYEDHSYFTRLFKKKVGITPKEFQNKFS